MRRNAASVDAHASDDVRSDGRGCRSRAFIRIVCRIICALREPRGPAQS